MTRASAPPRRILVVLGQGSDHAALDAALPFAEHHAASLEIFSCIQPPHDLNLLASLAGRTPEALMDELCTSRRDEIARLLAEKRPEGSFAIHLRTGKPFLEVIRFVLAHGVDLVIKTAEPLGSVKRFLFGSTDQHLLRKCPCPVWLVAPDADPVPRTVLAAVDLDEDGAAEPDTLAALNRRIIETARHVAAPGNADIFALHGWDIAGDGLVWAFSATRDAEAASEQYTRQIREKRKRSMDLLLKEVADAGSGADTPAVIARVVRGLPERIIRDQIELLGADLVVMGTIARTGLGGVIIGNTAENIINSLECPVLAVKPEGFVSPIAPE